MSNIDDDLGQLERDVRQLKIEYEQYFGGGRARPPADTEWRIEQIMKRYGDRGAEMNYAQRFRYGNLAQTYVKYKEIFHKRLRQREEGTVQRHFGAAAKAIEAARTHTEDASPKASAAGGSVFAMVCSDPAREGEKVAQLYQALRQAKEKAGERLSQLTAEQFEQFVRQKTEQLKKQKGCREVEYVVAVEGGHVRLKARVKS